MHAMAKVKESDEGSARANPVEERARLNLCQFIRDSGYTATQVADLAGMPQANLGRYMRGDSALSLDVLPRLAEVLGRDSTDDFFKPDPPRQKTAAELGEAQPIFAKARPGFSLTEEDLIDFKQYLERVRSRREKKKPRK